MRACGVRQTWLGAPEFWTWGLLDPRRGGSLNRVHGFPSVCYTLLILAPTLAPTLAPALAPTLP